MRSKILLTIIDVAILVAVLILAGCGHVSVEKTDTEFKMSTWTLFKDVENVSGTRTDDSIEVTLGSSTSTEEASALMMVCVINPGLPMCSE